MRYRENTSAGNPYRVEYREGLSALLKARSLENAAAREKLHPELLQSPDAFRRRVRQVLGWPLTGEHRESCPVRLTPVAQDGDIAITRTQLEVQPGLWLYGILFQNGTDRRPLVIAQHGGQGTPEQISSFFDSANYHDMTRRLLGQGVHVFCPQLLLWDERRFGSCSRDAMDAALKYAGSSIAAIEINGISQYIDWLVTMPFVNECAIGMVGLSFGGFYTLFTAALDPRIKAALSSCFFNDRNRYAWQSWTWAGAEEVFGDAEIAALVYPRKLWLEVGDHDPLFDIAGAKHEFDRLMRLRPDAGDRLHWGAFAGVHEFSTADDGVKYVITELFQHC